MTQVAQPLSLTTDLQNIEWVNPPENILYLAPLKVRGVLCLKHIVKNVSPTELKWHGRSDLIENTFLHLLGVRDEAELAAVLLPAFLDFIGVVGR